MVFLLQPQPEILLTVFTVTFPAVFIGNVPRHDIIIIFIALRQLSGQDPGIFPVCRTVGTGIRPSPELSFPTLKINPENIRIFSCHPGRMHRGGSGHADFQSVLPNHLHDPVQLFKMIFFF